MAMSSFPFDGQDTSETDYSFLFRELQDTGVVGSGSELFVTGDSSGMTVKVQPGMAIVRGHAFRSTAIETVPIDQAAANPRIDTVILRLDPAANSVVLTVLKGTPAIAPSSPSRTRTDSGIYELVLADVMVRANTVTIAAQDVTDVRRRTGHRINRWTTALRPLNPRAGQLGLNTDTGKWEWHNGTEWIDLASWATLAGRPTTSTLDGRNIFVNDLAPTAAQGANGDVWFEF